MATFQGRYPANTYKMLLNIDNTDGVDATLRTVQDGEGTSSVLQLSTTTLNVNGTFQVGGFTVTVPAAVTFGGAFITSGAYSLTLTTTAATNVTLPTTGTLATLAGSETFTNKTLTSPVIATISNTGTITLPTSTDTLVGRNTTDTLTNKTLTSPAINGGVIGHGASALRFNDSDASHYTVLTADATVPGVINTITLPTGTGTVSLITATETLTNKTLTSPTINTPTITTPSISGCTITDGSISIQNSGTASDIRLYEASGNGTSYSKIIATSAMSATRTVTVPDTDISCFVVQRVSTQTGAVATGTTTIPFDNTIPQNTEGDQYMSLAITPKNTANILKIEVIVYYAVSINHAATTALFQDSTANALAAMEAYGVANQNNNVKFTHTMSAGTTSATTFKVRIGNNAAATTTFNGNAGAQVLGGVLASSIVITEYSS